MPASWTSYIGFDSTCKKWEVLLQSGRLPSCLLLTGRKDIGVEYLLQRLAAMFFCISNGCGLCPHCLQIGSNLHADILSISGDSLGLQEAVALQRHLEVHPLESAGCKQAGGVRIVLVHDVERWTRQGVNRLLKTLEELPSYAYVFFSTSRPKQLLPTLLSRCVRFAVKAECISAQENEEEMQWRQDISVFWQQVFSASMPADVLAQELWSRKGGAVPIAESVEYALNQWYRSRLVASGQSITGIRARRQGLREWKKLAIQDKIMINSQLAAEAFALRCLELGK